MPLESYKSKRKFDETPEPEGGESPGEGRRFCVQEHHARRLHWDFRLEIDGVLKSWAIPKGPSMNPRDKRLAVQTEDHPLDYLTFEGEIPEGNYGAGQVRIWDIGNYEPLDPPNPTEGVENGKLTFRLNGNRLHGEFHMVKTKADWLIFKARDEYADENWAMEQLVSDEDAHKEKVASAAVVVGGSGEAKHPVEVKIGKPAAMPSRIDPMLATLADEPFDNPDWLFEPKWDGYRVICFINGPNARFESRNRIDLGERFPQLAGARDAVLAETAVIDGELVALNEQGVPSFQMLQNASGFGQQGKKRPEKPPALMLFVFDLIHCNGHDLSDEPLIDRKRLLAQIVEPNHPMMRVTDHIEGWGKALYDQAIGSGLEGIVAKDSHSRYEQRRSRRWLKIKGRKTIDVVIGGYTQGRRTRSYMGALVVGLYRGTDLHYVGNVGGGFSEQTLKEVYDILQPLKTDESPFAVPPKTEEPAQWVRPELVCEARYAEMTDDERLRQPIFLGMRPDKRPEECVFEEAEPEPAPREGDDVNAAPDVPLTHPERVYWPEDKITKADMFDYYSRVADVMVPHLIDRPLILKRYPEGIRGEMFYQHNLPDTPDFVRKWQYQDDEGQTVNYVLCNDKATLQYLANLGVIEIHPWNAKSANYQHPDRIVFDLDPGPDATLASVCETAYALHEVLESIGLQSFPKTSGKRGVHLCVPIDPIYTHEQTTAFAEAVANLVRARNPRLVTVERTTRNRPKGTVYLDYLQNGMGKALVAPYSLRAENGAPVSTPVAWDELESCPEPAGWTMRMVPDRVAKTGDLLAEALTLRQNLGEALGKIEKLT
jgi:bifunctional non-homologous end joining protein LigD